MRRREFLVAAGGVAGCSSPVLVPEPGQRVPRFLAGHEGAFAIDPRRAALAWFREAGTGLFLQYGVYSQLGRGPDVQFRERIPLAEYSQLGATFDPSRFNADRITEIAAQCGMGYVGLPARHADGFCLFRTIESNFNSLECAGRDLVGELAAACRQKALGLLLSYSYAADWRHPYFFPAETSRSDWRGSRPPYNSPPPEYRFQKDEDFLRYIRYAHNQLEEIVFRYEPVAGIWLEPLAGYHARRDLFPVRQTYSILREAQPGILIGFGPGASGDEDFASDIGSGPQHLSEEAQPIPARLPTARPVEVCRDLSARFQGGEAEARSLAGPELVELSNRAAARGVNLLLRASLEPDGSLRTTDERNLLEFARLRAY